MSLLSEALVEEWLNRRKYFTIRGVKTGVDEIDLLGIQLTADKRRAIHVECEVSFRPIGYITPLPKEVAKEIGKARTSAWERPDELLRQCVREWVKKKFKQSKKAEVRNGFIGSLTWEFALVHGVTREERELAMIKDEGVKLIPFYDILQMLCANGEGASFKGNAGTDIAEMIEYFDLSTSFDPKRNVFMQDATSKNRILCRLNQPQTKH